MLLLREPRRLSKASEFDEEGDIANELSRDRAMIKKQMIVVVR